ncbi:YceI family protein [Alteromonas sp. ASW11-36]|uniref:YceI family protein n=1 Tax=Alteromonas arenosi TaxID=3055817 RepID=A0ABT7T2P9_9ALTE|nr:YceI family protein [Alteromonas sp. ASW11-36]MDM7862067.1 YceI family protein [Alteromonas sp. ASW11-36]
MRLMVLSMLLCCSSAFANWQLDLANSSINFISTKNTHISEIHQFDRFSGSLNDAGEVSVSIDLTSVNTMIPIRDSRMQELLFNVSEFAQATFTAKLSDDVFSMSVGEQQILMTNGELALHGATSKVPVHVKVVRVSEDVFIAYTTKPSMINASQFGLAGGVDALQKIAGLANISYAVPVSFSVQFVR